MPGEISSTPVDVRRSRRRKRTVSAYREGERIVVLIPATMSRAQEQEWVDTMVARIERSERRRRPSDQGLLDRATALNERYLGGKAQPLSVRWVTNQNTRWGSSTPTDRSIRISHRVQAMPDWVIDYVLIHELVHLLEPSHNARFWELTARYPKAERAQGYLDGYATAARLEPPTDHLD